MHFYGAYSYTAGVLRQRYFTINIITWERNKINPNANTLAWASISLCSAGTESCTGFTTYARIQSPSPQFCSPSTWNLKRILLWGWWRVTKTGQQGKTDWAKIQTSLPCIFCSSPGMKQRWNVVKSSWCPTQNSTFPLSSLIGHTSLTVWLTLCCTKVFLNDIAWESELREKIIPFLF